MKAIVAINQHGYIGRNGQMMWRSSEDFKHFKEMTMHHILLCGRITYEQCLGGKDLPGRETIVIGKEYNTLNQALLKAELHSVEKECDIWVIGGGQIYEILLPFCNELHLSHIDNPDIGDCKFVTPNNFRGQVFDYYFRENKKV